MRREMPVVAAVAVVLALAQNLVPELGWPDRDQSDRPLRVSASNAVGDPSFVVRGATAEGEAPEVILANQTGEIRVEFAGPVPVHGLVLQASPGADYFFEGSLDGRTWIPVWEAAAHPGSPQGGGAMGAAGELLRKELSPPSFYSVVRLRAQGRTPALPRVRMLRVRVGEDGSGAAESGSGPPSFPWLSLREVEGVKLLLAIVGGLLVCANFLASRCGRDRRLARWLRAALVATALVAGLGWWNFFQITASDFDRTHKHYHDAYHYYLGAKYLPELGYVNLYRCQLAADEEDGLIRAHLRRPMTRDLATNERIPTARAVADAPECKKGFSADRWTKFKRDNAWFRGHIPPDRYLWMALDHGYNGSPVFAAAARPLLSWTPISDLWFGLIASIDTVLLVFLWYAASYAFGWEAASIALLLWATNLVADDHNFLMGAFMRLDSFFLVALGVVCLRLRRAISAGFFLGWAAALRIFPAFLIGGVGFAVLWEMWKRRALVPIRRHRNLLFGVAASLVLAFLVGSAAGGGPSAWIKFAENTGKHHRTVQLQNMGMSSLIALIDHRELLRETKVRVRDLAAAYASPKRRLVRLGLAFIVLPVLWLASWREEDWVASIFGVVWLPFVTDVNNYYWWLLVPFGFLIARKPGLGPVYALLMVSLALIGWEHPGYSLARYTWASLAIMLFFGWVVASFLWEKRRGLRDLVAGGAIFARGPQPAPIEQRSA